VAAMRGGANQYPPGPRDPRAAPGDRRATSSASTASSRPGHRGLVTTAPPRRSPPRCSRLRRARRRGASRWSPTTTRTPLDRDGGGSASPCTLRAAGLRLDATRSRGVHRGPACCWSTRPHNPTGACSTAASCGDRRPWPSSDDLLVVTDEVYEHMTYDGSRTSRSRRCRDGRADADDLHRRQDVLAHTAGRSAGAPGPAELVAAVRTAKQFLTFVQRGAVPARHRGRRSRCPTTTTTLRAGPRGPSGTASATGSRRWVSTSSCRAGRTSHADIRRWTTRTAWSSAATCRSACAGRHPLPRGGGPGGGAGGVPPPTPAGGGGGGGWLLLLPPCQVFYDEPERAGTCPLRVLQA
jgi:hypothetical protein